MLTSPQHSHISTACSHFHSMLASPQHAHISTACSHLHSMLTFPQHAHISTACSHLHSMLTSPQHAHISTACSHLHSMLAFPQHARIPTACSHLHSMVKSPGLLCLQKYCALLYDELMALHNVTCRSPRVVVSTAAFHARVQGSIPGLDGLKETKMFLPHPRVKVSIVGNLRDLEVACSASDRQGSNFESRVWRTVSSHSSRHPQEVLLSQFSLYVHKGGLNHLHNVT